MIAMATPVAGITNDFDNDTRNPCTPDIGADEQTSYSGPAIATVTITKTADANVVTYGNQVGFVVKLTNTTANTAIGLAVTDNLPAAPGVNWTIDAGATDPGWSVVGAPPTQSLQYSPSTLAGNTMSQAHVVSATTVATCGSTLNNTASFSITNGCPGSSSGMASASIRVTGGGGLTTILSQDFESGLGSWTVANNSTGGCGSANVLAAWTLRPNPYSVTAVGCGSSATESLNSGSGSQFLLANADAAGSGVVVDTQLISPSFNTVGYTSLNVTFKHYLRWLSATTGTVGVSTDGGATWTPVQTYNTATIGAATAFANANINLDAFVGQANVMLRFRYQAGWDYYWALDDIVVSGNAPIQPCPTALTVNSAVSRVTQGGAGDFDVPLPGVECRSTGGIFKLVITFSNNVVSGSASVTSGTGSVMGSPTFSGNTMTVDLTGVTDVQMITVTLTGVTDVFSQVLADTPVNMTLLIGDTTGNGSVNGGDVAQTKGQASVPVTGANFRNDVTINGSINAGDVALVKSKSGNHVP